MVGVWAAALPANTAAAAKTTAGESRFRSASTTIRFLLSPCIDNFVSVDGGSAEGSDANVAVYPVREAKSMLTSSYVVAKPKLPLPGG